MAGQCYKDGGEWSRMKVECATLGYEKVPAMECGSCDRTYPDWGPNGQRWAVAKSRDDVSACEAICDAHDDCGAFNFVASGNKCFFRRNDGSCKRKVNLNRDCYVKRDSNGASATA